MTWTKGKEDELRGCIGTFAPQKLSKILSRYALISALQDSRFDPISKSELHELSRLTLIPMAKVTAARSFLRLPLSRDGTRKALSSIS